MVSSLSFNVTNVHKIYFQSFYFFRVNLEQTRYDENIQRNAFRSNLSHVISTITSTLVTQAKSTPTNDNGSDDGFWDFDRNTCIYIYSAITAFTVIITLTRSFTFFTICMRASIRLHDKMFSSITHATMRFFNLNPSGRILNRFSKDMGAIDELLPSALMDCLQIGLTLIGIIVVVGIVNPILLIPTALCSVIFYYLRIFYIATGRNVKRLEGVSKYLVIMSLVRKERQILLICNLVLARSPVFSHLNASLQGLTTIRAFKAQEILVKEFDNHQDLHSSAWFMFLSTSRAFGFWLDLVCIIYITIVTLSFLLIGNGKFFFKC